MSGLIKELLGPIVTLVAACSGFSGVIYSQRKLMQKANDDRLHQEKLAVMRAATAVGTTSSPL